MSELIAIVDDEPDIRNLVDLHLTKNGYKTKTFSNGKTFLKFLKTDTPDLLILDLMLPEIDGMEICKKLRDRDGTRSLPIIMLTAKDAEVDRVMGLEIGADDYVTKPFSVRELVARVKAVLRRGKDNNDNSIKLDDNIEIKPQSYEVISDEGKIELTGTEFNLLKILAKNKGSVLSREQILTRLWDEDKIVSTRTIDVHIRNIRKKLNSNSDIIKNVRGVGYKIDN